MGVGRATRGGLLHQRLRVAQRHRQRTRLQAVDEPLAGLQTALYVEGQHAAAALHLAAGDVVLGVTLQHGINAWDRERSSLFPSFSSSRPSLVMTTPEGVR